jgi:hypothetical protein
MLDQESPEFQAIHQDFLANFMTEDGLMNLDPWSWLQEQFPELPKDDRKAHSDNGISYLDYYVQQAIDMGIPKEYFEYIVKSALDSITIGPGRIRRSRFDARGDAHDNMLSYVRLSKMYGLDYHKQVADFGDKHWYCFNNENPDKYDIRYQRQGGDIAFYNLMAIFRLPNLFTPFWWLFMPLWVLWMVGGMLVAKKPDSRMMRWLRLRSFGLPVDLKLTDVQAYFKPGHPVRRLVELANGAQV